MTWEQSPQQLLGISVDQTGSAAVITLTGELDLSNTERLYDEIRQVIDNGATEVTCDVAELGFVDSTGISVFLTALRRLGEVGGTFVLRSPTPAVTRTLEIAGVLPFLLGHPPTAPSA
jgi:stage II sporulation protein AA (anti-sigma F factor antagonist)